MSGEIIHRAPLEPTSRIMPCCGQDMDALHVDPVAGLTNMDRHVTCKPDENLGLNDVLQALVDSITGRPKVALLARLREIRAEHGDDDFRRQADDLLRGADLPPRFVEEKGNPAEIPHGEPGHACIPPEALMQVQDSLKQLLDVVAGHRQALIEQQYPEPVVYSMIANLHAVLLNRML